MGLVIRSIRINPEITEFVRINVRRYKLLIFKVLSLFCGLAGALFAILNGAIHPGFSDCFTR